MVRTRKQQGRSEKLVSYARNKPHFKLTVHTNLLTLAKPRIQDSFSQKLKRPFASLWEALDKHQSQSISLSPLQIACGVSICYKPLRMVEVWCYIAPLYGTRRSSIILPGDTVLLGPPGLPHTGCVRAVSVLKALRPSRDFGWRATSGTNPAKQMSTVLGRLSEFTHESDCTSVLSPGQTCWNPHIYLEHKNSVMYGWSACGWERPKHTRPTHSPTRFLLTMLPWRFTSHVQTSQSHENFPLSALLHPTLSRRTSAARHSLRSWAPHSYPTVLSL